MTAPNARGWLRMVFLLNRQRRRFGSAAIDASSLRYGVGSAPSFSARPFLVVLGTISTIMNLLMLLSVVFVLELFQQVMPNHDVNLLVVLLGIVILAYLLHAVLQLARMRILRRFADAFDGAHERVAFRATSEGARAGHRADTESAVRDLGRIRGFILDGALTGLLDLPWVLVFIGVLTFLHPLLGIVSASFTLIVAALTIIARNLSGRAPDVDEKAATYLRAISMRDGSEQAFGLLARFEHRWIEARSEGRHARRSAQLVPDLLRSLANAGRMLHGIAVLATAAYLTLRNLAGFGVIISSGILVRRISVPVDAVVRGWPDISHARAASLRLKQYRRSFGASAGLSVPARPSGPLVVEGVSGGLPGRDKPVLLPVSFTLQPGESLGVVGPSGAGKSTLANILAGRWAATSGKMLIGGVDRFKLANDEAAHFIGYVPQRVRFFDGSIAENISRFAIDRDEERLRQAVQLARLDNFVARLTAGLDTQVSANGHLLPAGIAQRLALARAVYRDPLLLILDDPTIHLDRDGEQCLAHILKVHRERGGITVMATNQLPFLRLCERILVLKTQQRPVVGMREEFIESEDAGLIGQAGAAGSRQMSV